jgi:capsular polysaccharide biosynthesis protein
MAKEGHSMSLLLIFQKIWRYKLVTLPVAAFVLVGAFYVIAVKAPAYEASSTLILVNPPAPPSDTAIARDPSLAHVDADNPYTRYSDQSVVVQVLAGRLSSDDARQALTREGADPTYTVAPSPEFGFSAPIVQITGTGSSAAAAVKTANLVGLAVKRELDRMQAVQNVAPRYRIVTQQVVAPHRATLKASGKLRALVAVCVLGTLLLFLAVSIADAVTALRAERRRKAEFGTGLDGIGSSLEPLLPLDPDETAQGAGPPRRSLRRRQAAAR